MRSSLLVFVNFEPPSPKASENTSIVTPLSHHQTPVQQLASKLLSAESKLLSAKLKESVDEADQVLAFGYEDVFSQQEIDEFIKLFKLWRTLKQKV